MIDKIPEAKVVTIAINSRLSSSFLLGEIKKVSVDNRRKSITVITTDQDDDEENTCIKCSTMKLFWKNLGVIGKARKAIKLTKDRFEFKFNFEDLK